MPALVLLLLMLLTPILEILLIVQAVGWIGGWWTLGVVLATSVLGGWIVRREGRRAWRVLQEAVQRGGALPDRELSGAALVLAGGLLLVAPGFLTDVTGLLFVLPFTRPLVRRLLTSYGARRMRAAEARGASMFPPGAAGGLGGLGGLGGFGPHGGDERGGAGGPSPQGRVVQGEVVQGGAVPDDDRPGQK